MTQIAAFDCIDSTSDEARRRALAGTQGPLWITARSQTAGRGRRGRSWVSEPGNLYASLLLRPDVPVAQAGQYSFLAAVALAEAIEAYLPPGPDLALKWPNDVLIDGRKAAGILLESQGRPDGRIDWLTIGIGVNLAHAPQGTETPAMALSEIGCVVAPDELIETLAARFAARDEGYLSKGFAVTRENWLARAAGLGQTIRVRLHDRTLTGRFAALDESGALVLDSDGQRTSIAAGEVFLTAEGN